MSESDLSKIQEELNKFATKFEEVSMTLIAKMSEIDDKLNRINMAVELVEKLRIQKAENKRIMENVESGFKNLLRRLESLAKDGFVIPEGGQVENKVASLGALNMTIETSANVEDDLSDLGEPPSMEEIEKQLISMGELAPNSTITEQQQIKKDLGPPIQPTTTLTQPIDQSNIQQPQIQPNISSISPAQIQQKEPSISNVPSVNVQYTQSASGIPKSNIQKIPNPIKPKEILQNLIVDIEEANLESHVGILILQAKDQLAKLIPFHSTYFDMVMTGGKIKTSQKPNSITLVEELKKKINEWMQKFQSK